MVKFFKKLFRIKPKIQLHQSYIMTVLAVALGERAAIPAAIAMHRRYLNDMPEQYKETDFYGYMHEVDNMIPDYISKSRYRRKLLKQYNATAPVSARIG